MLKTCKHSGECKREIFTVIVTKRATMAGPEDPENFGEVIFPDDRKTCCLKW